MRREKLLLKGTNNFVMSYLAPLRPLLPRHRRVNLRSKSYAEGEESSKISFALDS